MHTFKRLQRHHRLVWIKRGRLVNQRRPGFRIQSSKSCKRYIEKSKTPILILALHCIKNVRIRGFSVPEYGDTEYLSVFSMGSEKKDQKTRNTDNFHAVLTSHFSCWFLSDFATWIFYELKKFINCASNTTFSGVIAFQQWKLLDPFPLVIMIDLMTENVQS